MMNKKVLIFLLIIIIAMLTMNKKMLIILLIAIVAIAAVVLITHRQKQPKENITKQELLQKFQTLKTEYEEAKSEGYDVLEVERLGREAKEAYDKEDYKKANELLDKIDKAFEALEKPTATLEDILPPNLSPVYKQAYIERYEWLDKKLVELKPAKYKPMMFTGFHLPISYELYPYTNSTDDIKFLDMLVELDVDVIGVGVRAPAQHTKVQLERLDTLFSKVRENGKKLKLWYFGGEYNNKTAYIETGYRATKDIIERWHPDYYAIVHEPTTQEKAYNFDMSPEEWQEYIKKNSNIAKDIDPNVKTSVTVVNYRTDIEYIDYFVQIPSIDIVGFDIYHIWGLCDNCEGGNLVEQKIKLIQSRGKKVWIEETWLSSQWDRPKTDPPKRFEGFDHPNRALWDSKWMQFITYYAQQHDIEAVEPFFTNYFILYPGYDPYANEQKYVKDYKTALYEGKRTPTFYEFKNVIEEVKGNQL